MVNSQKLIYNEWIAWSEIINFNVKVLLGVDYAWLLGRGVCTRDMFFKEGVWQVITVGGGGGGAGALFLEHDVDVILV